MVLISLSFDFSKIIRWRDKLVYPIKLKSTCNNFQLRIGVKKIIFLFKIESLSFINVFLSSFENTVVNIEFNFYTLNSSILLLSDANLDSIFLDFSSIFFIFFVSFTLCFFKVTFQIFCYMLPKNLHYYSIHKFHSLIYVFS